MGHRAGCVLAWAMAVAVGLGCTGSTPAEREVVAIESSTVVATPAGSAPAFECPVTLPNGRVPPGQRPSSQQYGEGEFYTTVPPDGVIRAPRAVGGTPPAGWRGSPVPPGWLDWKWIWFRPTKGAPLAITGVRLDGPAEPVIAWIPDGYSERLQATAVFFSEPGCWEVTAESGGARLRVVTLVRSE